VGVADVSAASDCNESAVVSTLSLSSALDSMVGEVCDMDVGER
jgi:hypothetical protein